MMAFAAANSPRNQARMASLAKESETISGAAGGEWWKGAAAAEAARPVGPAAIEIVEIKREKNLRLFCVCCVCESVFGVW